ncbi:hypothetical protein X741_18545 [Mesorhizobium sp. LNHC229A00]|nr:hypothetical protein X741_18545 [Mesorhizobium sp. LNHC229A00]
MRVLASIDIDNMRLYSLTHTDVLYKPCVMILDSSLLTEITRQRVVF